LLRLAPVATRARVCASTGEASSEPALPLSGPVHAERRHTRGFSLHPDTERPARRGLGRSPPAPSGSSSIGCTGGEVRRSCDDPLMLVAGVDACRGGWIAVVLDADQFADSISAPTFVELLRRVADTRVVGVDIPIGLPSDGVRAADVAARVFVGPRRSSVFPTPPRAALVAATYAEARAVLPSLSAQSFALGKKILEVEACLEERVIEVHPEVSFAALAGRPLRNSKRSWNGQMERRLLLASAGIELPDELTAGHTAADDVLDAAIVAWSAARKERGEAATLPVDPPVQDGRPVAIWY
jgi:predicted RNase H-like nuclease